MKKQNYLVALLLLISLLGHSQDRSPWANIERPIEPAVELKSSTAGFSLELQWEISISAIASLPHPSGFGYVNPSGVATDGNEVFVCASNMAELYKYEFDGTYLGPIDGVPGVGAVIDLNYNHTNGDFIGSWLGDVIHQFNIANNDYVADIVTPVSNGVMAWDFENGIIYSAGERNTGYDNPINVLTEEGELLYSFARQNGHVYSGLAYDERVPCLWGLCKNTSSKNTLVQISLPSGEETGLVFELPDYFNSPTVGKPAGGLSMTYLEGSDEYLLTGMVKERFVWGMTLSMDDPLETDAEILSMVSPLSTMALLGSYPVELRIKNAGNTTISSIPVTCSLDGGTPASYTIGESIPAGEYLDVILPMNVQFTAFGESHQIELEVNYPNDENQENNSLSYVAQSIEPYYYQPNSYCEYGDGILSFELGDISNLNTGCTNSGYGDYTDMSTNVVIGNTNTAYLATAGPTQSGFMWIDFNNDFFFDNETELVTDQYWIPDGGMHPVEFSIPEGTEPGTYRLRALVEWVLEEFPYYPNAQIDMGYGEMEDYTLIVTEEDIELDAGIFDIDMPTRVFPGELTPSVTVKNFGILECSFEVTATADSYSSTKMVNNLASKDTEVVTFDAMDNSNGDYNLEFCTSLVDDEVSDNDCLDYDFRVCDIQRENVLVEIGTGTWCGYCPGAAMGADDLVANGKDVAIIEYHSGDDYYIAAGGDRISYYGMTSFPTSVFDGNKEIVGGDPNNSIYNLMLPLYETAIELPSAYSLEVEMTENADLDFQLYVTINNPEGFEDNDIRLFTVLTESHIPENWQNQTEVNFVARAVYPDSEGTPISFESANSATYSQNIVLPSNYDMDHCKLNVFVQDINTAEVWQTETFGFDIVGLEESAQNHGPVISPNPAHDEIFIHMNGKIKEVLIYNQHGQVMEMRQGDHISHRLNIDHLASGIYFVKVIAEDHIIIEKVIKN